MMDLTTWWAAPSDPKALRDRAMGRMALLAGLLVVLAVLAVLDAVAR